MTSEKDEVANFLHNNKRQFAKISCRVRNATFNNLQDILQRHPFLMSPNFEIQSYQWYGVKRVKFIYADMGNSGIRFGTPLYHL